MGRWWLKRVQTETRLPMNISTGVEFAPFPLFEHSVLLWIFASPNRLVCWCSTVKRTPMELHFVLEHFQPALPFWAHIVEQAFIGHLLGIYFSATTHTERIAL
jgi:hypothetical protein